MDTLVGIKHRILVLLLLPGKNHEGRDYGKVAAKTSYKWGWNHPYKKGFFTPQLSIYKVISRGPITPFIIGRGPPCRWCLFCCILSLFSPVIFREMIKQQFDLRYIIRIYNFFPQNMGGNNKIRKSWQLKFQHEFRRWGFLQGLVSLQLDFCC